MEKSWRRLVLFVFLELGMNEIKVGKLFPIPAA
jgi:hypothetical protein